MAERHVKDGRAVIDRLLALIARRQERNMSTVASEELLDKFLCTQAIFEDDLAAIIK